MWEYFITNHLTLETAKIKVELDSSFDFEGFPKLFIPIMEWEQLEKELASRKLIQAEVEENLKGLEALKAKVTYSSYKFVENTVNGHVQDIKLLHQNFRRKAAENSLLEDEGFVADATGLVSWYLQCYNRLDKIRPKVMPKSEDPSNVLEAGSIGTVMHNSLYTLEKTLQNIGLTDRDTNPTLKRPHFKGGKNSFSDFENFEKNFNLWTRKTTDKVKLLQLLRDTLSGPALEQIEELEVCADNYEHAWTRLKKVYYKKDEYRSLIIEKIFNYQFSNIKVEHLEEQFNSFIVLIDKLKTTHGIDLLNKESGFDTVLAHLTFKKFPQIIKNVIMQIGNNHYPTFDELTKHLPTAIERIQKSKGIGGEEVTSINTITNNYEPENVGDNKQYCALCETEHHCSCE